MQRYKRPSSKDKQQLGRNRQGRAGAGASGPTLEGRLASEHFDSCYPQRPHVNVEGVVGRRPARPRRRQRASTPRHLFIDVKQRLCSVFLSPAHTLSTPDPALSTPDPVSLLLPAESSRQGWKERERWGRTWPARLQALYNWACRPCRRVPAVTRPL